MKVSVIIPSYNHRQFLVRCLRSLADQTFTDFETIVVDDGSTDDTDAFLAAQPGLISIRQPRRGGAAARNAGAARAQGELLFFCDADVVLKKEALAQFVQVLDHHREVDFVYCSFRWGWRTFRALPFDPARLRTMNYISTMSMLRRSIFPGFDESLKRFQDWDLWLRVVKTGGRGWPIKQTLFHVARHAGEISHRREDEAQSRAVIKRKHGL